MFKKLNSLYRNFKYLPKIKIKYSKENKHLHHPVTHWRALSPIISSSLLIITN